MNNWKQKIQTSFGNGQKENETIGGYLGDLNYQIEEILASQREEIIEKKKGKTIYLEVNYDKEIKTCGRYFKKEPEYPDSDYKKFKVIEIK